MVKRTKQKEAILRVLKSTRSHPTAVWIYDEVRKEIPNISLATVYRNLRQLKQRGEILEIALGHGISRFDSNTKNHYHFRCQKCNRLWDVDEPLIRKVNQRVARNTGFIISHERLEFCGLCQECQTADNPVGSAGR